VTALIDFLATKRLLFGSPEIRVLRIEDFPFPANPTTMTDCVKPGLLSIMYVAVLFLFDIKVFNYNLNTKEP
jgi:hypothetical protein